jgi:hypothetical protein
MSVENDAIDGWMGGTVFRARYCSACFYYLEDEDEDEDEHVSRTRGVEYTQSPGRLWRGILVSEGVG